MERPFFETLNKEQQAYLDDLEAAVNGASKLVVELNLVCDLMAEEIAAIRGGKKVSGKFFSNDGNDKFFDRFMKLVTNIAALKAVSPKPETVEKKTKTNIAHMALNGNENI